MERLGQNSYAIYLVHFLVLRALVLVWPVSQGAPSLFILAAVALAVSYMIPLAIRDVIERPVRALSVRLTSARLANPQGSALAARQV